MNYNLKKNEAICSIVQTVHIVSDDEDEMDDDAVEDMAIRRCKRIFKGYDEYVVQVFGYDENGWHLEVRMSKKVKIK
jgi:hypothetical protein